jgi:hypothetical protein
MTKKEEEKKLTHLEWLVANVDFDDQALHILGFHTDIHVGTPRLGAIL